MINNNPLLNKALENIKTMEAQLAEESRILAGITEKECSSTRELEAMQGAAEVLRAELADKDSQIAAFRREAAKQRELNEALVREQRVKDSEFSALLEKERSAFLLAQVKLQNDAGARENEILAELTPLRETLRIKTAETERNRADAAAAAEASAAEFQARLEGERAALDLALNKAREGFFVSEKALLDENQTLKAAAAAGSAEAGKWKQELLVAKAGYTQIKGELEAAEVLRTEQNVLTRSSISALKELKEDLGRMKAMLSDREADIAGLNAEIGRLSAETREEKIRNAELKERLARELPFKEEMEDLLRAAAHKEEALKRKLELLNLDLKEKSTIIAYLNKEVTSARAAK